MRFPSRRPQTDRTDSPPPGDAPAGESRPTHRHAPDALRLVDLLVALQRYAGRVQAGSIRPRALDERGRPDAESEALADRSSYEPVAVDGGEPRFTARETDRGVVVVADLRGVVRDDHQTEVVLTEDALLLTVGDRFVCRVPIDPGRTSITDVSLNNDVLEARVDRVE